ncbi:endospore germination permease [Ammoniphilus sp. CFH 90114]|uniref:GerAB/ArcD/ProY family transporter n=1 Tax=Ammoniphilus sp. CFH 90114 TaxID=2493665 RepID=UPI00100DA2F6|nr:endospore germination permease [Ammoniphilus sp. CFH 90114]RXT03995.1 spore gernimation protein [Ammoniphilus sp. CFH 90114]
MERISAHQGMLIICALTLNSTLISVPAQVIGMAKQDAWICYLIAMVIPLSAWWLISRILARFPDHDLLTIMIERYPYLGRVFGFSYLLFFLIILARDIRLISDFINIIILQNTPIVVITSLAVITAIFMTRGGIELVGRTAEIYQSALILIVLSLPIFLLREFDGRDFLPIFEASVGDLLNGSWYAVAYLGEMIALAFMVPGKQISFRHGLWGFFIAIFLLEILITFNVTVLGPELAPRFMYPNQEMIRAIRITDFLDRLDLPIIGIWMPAMIVKIGVGLFLVCHAIKQLAPKISPKSIMGPLGLFSLVCSFWFFSDAIQTLNFNRTWPAIALLFEWLIPVLLFWILKPKNGRSVNK